MKIQLTWLRWPILATLIILAPMIAYGGLIDWLLPVGKIVEAGRDITIAIVLKQFLDRWMPLLGTLLIAGCGIACFWGAMQATKEFSSAFKAAMADNRITWKEGLGLIFMYPVSTAVAGVLLWFGGVFSYMASDALLQLATTVPPG